MSTKTHTLKGFEFDRTLNVVVEAWWCVTFAKGTCFLEVVFLRCPICYASWLPGKN